MPAHSNDAVINYEIEGAASAQVVTLSHALATNLGLWEPQMPALLRKSYRVLRFDTRGHGHSSVPQGPYTMETLAGDVIGLLDFLGIERTHFVGLSMGGMIGQVLAARYPERLEKLVLCDTSARVPPEMSPIWEDRIRKVEREGMTSVVQETLERWLSEEFRQKQPELTGRIRDMIVQTPIPGYAGCCRAISGFDMLADLPQIKASTLIMVGERDPGSPVSAAEEIKQQIHGAELFVIPAALHLTNYEAAEIFNQKLLEFLGEAS
jgi:3-oxoadipate enol-lactonase